MPEKVPELIDRKRGEKFVNHMKESLNKAGVSVDAETLANAMEDSYKHMVGCDQCANGWRW